MQFFMYGVSGFFWLICYFFAIWICVIGKKKNPNKGWNFIIAAEIIYIIAFVPTVYYGLLVDKLMDIFLLKISKYVYHLTWAVILPLGMILSLVGLYYIAQGKKRTSKKAIKKRRVN